MAIPQISPHLVLLRVIITDVQVDAEEKRDSRLTKFDL